MSALKALTAQLLGLALVLGLIRSQTLPAWPSLAFAALQAGAAMLVSQVLHAERWWLLVHALFGPTLLLSLRLHLPAWWSLLVFVGLLLVYWTPFVTRVPLFLSNRTTIRALADWLPPQSLTVLDIGSGNGGFARELLRLRPDCTVTGIELAPLPWALSRLAARSGGRLRFIHGNFRQHPLQGYDCVYAFLSPVPMRLLWEKARREMREGSWLVSNSFPVPGVTATEILEVGDRRRTELYCYRIGEEPLLRALSDED